MFATFYLNLLLIISRLDPDNLFINGLIIFNFINLILRPILQNRSYRQAQEEAKLESIIQKASQDPNLYKAIIDIGPLDGKVDEAEYRDHGICQDEEDVSDLEG